MPSPPAILCVDDDPLCRATIGALFVRQGFHVDIACGGEDGLDKLKNRRYDAILSDYQMPHIDGLELAIQVKKLYESTPIVLMTGACQELLKLHLDCGTLDGLLEKPFNQQTLLSAIESVMSEDAILSSRAEERALACEGVPSLDSMNPKPAEG